MAEVNDWGHPLGTVYRVESWTGRVLFDGKTFESFEDGWEYIYEIDPQPEDDEDENYYGDYYVEPVGI